MPRVQSRLHAARGKLGSPFEVIATCYRSGLCPIYLESGDGAILLVVVKSYEHSSPSVADLLYIELCVLRRYANGTEKT